MIDIRHAIANDFADVAALTNHFIEHTPIHFGWNLTTPEALRDEWQEKRTSFPFLIAESDSRFAGFAKAGTWRTRDAYAWTAETAVYVNPAMHRRGVGRALYTELLSILRAQGYHLAVAGITLPNDASVKLHEAVGFASVGVFRECGWKFDAWHDVGWYQLPLADRAHHAAKITPPADPSSRE